MIGLLGNQISLRLAKFDMYLWLFGMILALLASLAFVSPASAARLWTFSEHTPPTAAACGGADCCMRGETGMGKTCVLRTFSVVPGQAGGMVAIRTIVKEVKTRSQLGYIPFKGLANEQGQTLIAPIYAAIEPISETTAWAQRTDGTQVWVDMRGRERPFPYLHLQVTLGQSAGSFVSHLTGAQPQLAFGTNDAPGGPAKLTQLGINGEPNGFVIDNVREGFVNDKYYIFQTRNDQDQQASLFIDKTTSTLTAVGPAINRHSVLKNRDGCYSDTPQWFLSIAVRPSPMQIGRDSVIYLPLDSGGAPLMMPSGVIGVVPYVVGGDGACVQDWVVVTRVGSSFEYRIGGYSPAEAIAAYPRLARIVGLTDVDVDSVTRRLPGVRYVNFHAVRLAGQSQWIQLVRNDNFEVTPEVLATAQRGPTAQAVANSLGNAQAQVYYAAEAEKQKVRDAAAVALAALKDYFDRTIGQRGSDRARHLQAAQQIGGDAAARYATAYPDENPEVLCNLQVAAACAKVAQRAAESAAFWADKAAAESAWRSGVFSGVPEQRVTVHNNGNTSMMSMSDYRRIFGQ